MTIHDFDAIRPYEPEELPAAFDALIADPEFRAIMQSFFKDVPFETLKAELYACKDSLTVQKTFFYPLIQDLLKKCSDGATFYPETIPVENRKDSFTFISNHRDIVLDPALLCVLMMDHGFRTTVEIAIGDNLLVKPWIERLVKVNKSFLVQRSLGMREMLLSSKRMSRYMHFAIEEKKENIWIAQREGRAKDSNDRTQESVLKMMAMGGEGAPIESLKSLHIVPLAISYEYDPCDYLKAKEFQQKRDDAAFKKSPEDDLKNMQTGIFGYKGRVVYRTGTPVNEWIDTLADCPKGEVFRAVADRIDKEIHSRYEIFPVNRIALDLLNGNNQEADGYTEEEKEKFTAYIESRIAMVDLPERDEAFLRERLLTMVANPLINYYQSQD